MRTTLPVFFGIFIVMALSNTIVPILPFYDKSSIIQGAVYSAYFMGAFVCTLPAGILSDRYGRVPVIRIGLWVTVLAAFLLVVLTGPLLIIIARFIEGAGAGFVVAGSMSYVNSLPDHEKMSGYFMGLLNAGLVAGLVFAGWLASFTLNPAAGIIVFAILSLLPAVISFFIAETGVPEIPKDHNALIPLISEYRWLWYSSIVLIGITGVVTSLYPKFSGYSPESVGIWIAIMSCSTIIAVLVSSRLFLPPVITIRGCAFLMIIAVMISFYSPLGFAFLGTLAGIVMICQMTFLSQVRHHQGTAMGLFSTTGYLGMTALPVMAGFIADSAGFFLAFCATALVAITVFLTIQSCECNLQTAN